MRFDNEVVQKATRHRILNEADQSGTHVGFAYAPFLPPRLSSNLLGSENALFELSLGTYIERRNAD